MPLRSLITILSALVVGIFCGWFIGSRQESEIREAVRITQRPATRINLGVPSPVRVQPIALPKIQYHDTVREEVRIPADTAGIIADYFKQKKYELNFSTDTTGVFKVNATVVCNRLEDVSATIIPLQREVEHTVVKVRKFRPFVSGAIALSKDIGVSLGGGGIINERHIVRFEYMRLGDRNYVQGGYGFIFGK